MAAIVGIFAIFVFGLKSRKKTFEDLRAAMLFLLLQPDFALTLNVSTHGTATIFFLYSTFLWESLDDTNLSCLVPSYHLSPRGEREKNHLEEVV